MQSNTELNCKIILIWFKFRTIWRCLQLREKYQSIINELCLSQTSNNYIIEISNATINDYDSLSKRRQDLIEKNKKLDLDCRLYYKNMENYVL